jgi:dTDP-4-amino-4,6-dideoxygalactose transaminase
MTNRKKTHVTQPYLPPLEEFLPYLREIWDSRQLTNSGPFHQQLENALCDYLGVQHLSLFANGTIALVTALQAQQLDGEVITTPFSFVATSHALTWNNLKPVFVDINADNFNLDPDKIEAAITPQTTAIMPVHCYGIPCDVERIQELADAHGLRVIYDAAHAFGVETRGQSLLNCGDMSVLSFHATKVFNTFEGGAVVCPDAETKQRIDCLKNFGFVDAETVTALGINGKMNEIQAAMGLLQLEYIDGVIEARRSIAERYRHTLANVPGIRCFRDPADTMLNCAYFPILVEPDHPFSRDELDARLKDEGIFGRRYFYPLISDFAMYRGLPSAAAENLPTATAVAQKVLCLPIYPDLEMSFISEIAAIVTDQ